MSSKETVKEYMDYSTFHGIGRTKNAPYFFLKLFWVLALCASFGMITWQIHDLYKKFKSYPISTSVEVKTAYALEFPRVVICNTNPVMYPTIPANSDLDKIIQEASKEYSIDLNIFNTSDIYNYNYTTYDQNNKDKPISNDILLKTAERFKMHMAILDESKLLNMTQPRDEFILLCNFAGEECSDEAIRTLRTYHHGMCYMYDPQYQHAIKPYGKVSAVGPRYALEVLLHTAQSESVPFVTSSAGAVIGIVYEDSYFHEEKSIFVPTAFETNLALFQVRKDSVPGKKKVKRCKPSASDANKTGSVTLLDCQRHCTQEDIVVHCGCYQFFFDIGTINDSIPLNKTFDESSGWRPCYTEDDYKCIQNRLTAYIQSPPELCDTCLAPCREIVYERDISMVSWPDENYLPILRRIMKTKVEKVDLAGFDRDAVRPAPAMLKTIKLSYFSRGSLALVRIYLSSLSYQHVKEDYTYSDVDFISDIGGQLGLWMGCSVLSMFEVVELVVLLVASVKGRKTSPVDQEHPAKEDEGRE